MRPFLVKTVFFYLAFLLLSCGEEQNEPTELRAQTTANPAIDSLVKPVVYFGVISRYNPRLMVEDYQPIMDYLTQNTDYKFELKLGKTYEETVKFLCEGSVQIASLGGFTYLKSQECSNSFPILRPLNRDGKSTYTSIFIVRNDSPIKSLKDLAGHTVAFASSQSTSGYLVPRYTLSKAGIKLTDLQQYKNFPHHDNVVNAVLRGEFDAGAVKNIIALKALGKGLRIIHESMPIPSVPIVVTVDCDEKLITTVKATLLKINPADPEEKINLALWNEEFRYGFIEASDADYNILREIKKTVKLK
jgi:phosphonate transport system substrate-binding protein